MHYKDDIVRVCLWSGPRNISTALMYSFAQRSDIRVYDEPLYAHYLLNTNAHKYHPGAQEILNTMEHNGSRVVDMMLGPHDTPVVFFKHMTHHLVNIDLSFLKNVTNVILTRDPLEMLPSYVKQIKYPTIDDVGYKRHVEIVDYLNKMEIAPIVIDSKKILLNPEELLMKLCDVIGIQFEESMLTWQPGARSEDGCWAKYWYENVHRSTGFQQYVPKTKPFPQSLIPLLDECSPYYEQLIAYSL